MDYIENYYLIKNKTQLAEFENEFIVRDFDLYLNFNIKQNIAEIKVPNNEYDFDDSNNLIIL